MYTELSVVEVFTDKSHEEPQRKEDEKEHKVESTCSLILMPGSLLVFKDSAYTGNLGGFILGYLESLIYWRVYLNIPFLSISC